MKASQRVGYIRLCTFTGGAWRRVPASTVQGNVFHEQNNVRSRWGIVTFFTMASRTRSMSGRTASRSSKYLDLHLVLNFRNLPPSARVVFERTAMDVEQQRNVWRTLNWGSPLFHNLKGPKQRWKDWQGNGNRLRPSSTWSAHLLQSVSIKTFIQHVTFRFEGFFFVSVSVRCHFRLVLYFRSKCVF